MEVAEMGSDGATNEECTDAGFGADGIEQLEERIGPRDERLRSHWVQAAQWQLIRTR